MRPSTTTLGYRDNRGRVLAACSYSGNEAVAIGILYRHPEAPGSLGRLALAGALDAALEREECVCIMLSVRKGNPRLLELYQSIGFAIFQSSGGISLYLRGKCRIVQAITTIRCKNVQKADTIQQHLARCDK